MEENLIMEIWDTFVEYIPDKNKEMAANHFVDMLVGNDVAVTVFESVLGYDPHLDDAIKFVLDQSDESLDDDFSDDEEEDED